MRTNVQLQLSRFPLFTIYFSIKHNSTLSFFCEFCYFKQVSSVQIHLHIVIVILNKIVLVKYLSVYQSLNCKTREQLFTLIPQLVGMFHCQRVPVQHCQQARMQHR